MIEPPAADFAAGTRATSSYRVLARKYRPSTFDDLIGQDAMVRTVSNAFESGRIPQAWILTGVRGVGKTTTARILARGLNYQQADGSGEPTVHMPGLGVHCQAIIDSRHVDVLEMDAASHNGIDDIRQINEAVRYAPVSARYKVYILDEVHMLSTQAFNALLKTLEEPPPHVKFIFATTEIRKVPITILSRCQRFDLRRVDGAQIVAHMAAICAKESIEAETEALAIIARAAEGSVRDSLSLLDQAIAHAAGNVRAEDVRQMLGLADRSRVIDLFEGLMRGEIAFALREIREQYEIGADPAIVLIDLADFVHLVTRVKIVPSVAEDPSLAEVERTRAREFAASLSMRSLSRAWQMLFKGIPEVQSAAKPIAAAEMVLVRIAYSADLPTPDDVIRSLDSAAPPAGSGAIDPPPARAPEPIARRRDTPASAPSQGASGASGVAQRALAPAEATHVPNTSAIARFDDLVALAAEKRDLKMRTALERDVRLVRFEPGRLDIALERGAAPTLVNELSRKISEWTGQRWMIIVSSEQGAPPVQAQRQAQQAAFEQGVRADPLVRAVLSRFPGAEIIGVRQRDDASASGEPLPSEGEEEQGDPAPADETSAFGAHAAPELDD